MKSENLNFLEPSGPLQACNGTALLWDWKDPMTMKNKTEKRGPDPIYGNIQVMV